MAHRLLALLALLANGLDDVALDCRAVATADGPLTFDVVRTAHAISGRGVRTVPREWMRDELVEQVQVEGVTLASLLEQHSIDHVDIMKMDVEGSEVDVLAASRDVLPRIDRIVVERHSREQRDGLAKLLGDAGFGLVFEEDPECERYFGDIYFARHKSQGGLGR